MKIFQHFATYLQSYVYIPKVTLVTTLKLIYLPSHISNWSPYLWFNLRVFNFGVPAYICLSFFCVFITFINPIPAEVLENQDMLGGGQFDPPPLNPIFNVQLWQMIHHWKALCSSFRICKKKKSSYKEKMFAKKCPENDKIYIFKKRDHTISYMQNFK